ncbi:MAG TPA: FAD-linked oxidase C-terminal domain-containing protein [Solirubrobacteraceae bacterium]|jgi:glycolate oxidase|nr:FAD-linked oxidase C-terminal domain-containing protein [Solirubrobacteraceae bacterium]
MADGARLIARLQEICGAEYVLTHEHALATYRSDGLAQYQQTPVAAVLPATGEQVRKVVAACFADGVPWVARGAGTGLSGGALPVADGVLIVLARLRRIVSVELEDSRIVVEPGVTNLAVSRVVGPTHFYPPDPSSQIVCSIGGNVAENSGGAHCFKYGFTTNYVTGLEVVLTDGTVVELDRDAPGYDLLGAFVGSEGTLGVATKIALRVVPVPETTRTLVAFFDATAEAGDAVTEIVGAGIVPGAIEMMDRLSIRAAEEATGAGYRLDAGAALLIELDGPREECTARFEHVMSLCARAGARDVRVALSAHERELIWKARKAAFAAMGRIAPAYYVQDGVIPRTRLSQVLRRIEALASEYKLEVANVFHAGDGNLHPLVCYDSARPGEPERAEELAGLIVRMCVEEGGSITGEHGVGVDKRAYMPAMFSDDDLEAFHRLRCAFDPHGLANPGKVMPTPRLCGEVPGPYREHPLEREGVAARM